ncbi:MAG: T9SS type A sorting domain-containing protein [Candidatus Brennerbacteria bacterium]|nr:T9SS type A sorting domain-containing protein [Candidatus Brennerbacteria bacterium]
MKRLWILAGIFAMLLASVPFQGWAQTSARKITFTWAWPWNLKGQQVNARHLLVYDDSLIFAGTNLYLYASQNKSDFYEIGPSYGLDLHPSSVEGIVKTKDGGILVAAWNGIFKSTDRGESWRHVWDPENESLVMLFATKNGTVFAGGDGLYKSIDDGETWEVILAPNHPLIKYYTERMTEAPSGYLYIGLNSGVKDSAKGVLRSTDRGETWKNVSSGLTSTNILSIAADTVGWYRGVYVATDGGGIFHSSNEGDTWQHVDGVPEELGEVVYVGPAPFGTIAGVTPNPGDPILYQRVSEEEWKPLNLTGFIPISIVRVDALTLAIGTNDGVWMAKWDDIVKVEDNSVPTEFVLKQNYPNPFNPSTTIEFTLPDRSHVRLTVYNALGQEVVMLVDEEVSAGTHRTTWDASGLPSGIYFARMNAGAFTMTKKMVLMK